MRHSIKKNIFTGGLNCDIEDRWLPEEDYRYMLNMHNGSSDDKNGGTPENVKGNTKFGCGMPEGENATIGSLEDIEQKSIFFFNYNSEGNHGIYRYFPYGGRSLPDGSKEGECRCIFMCESLGFQKDIKVVQANFIDCRYLRWVSSTVVDGKKLEGSKPMVLDVLKADNTGKQKEYEIIVDLDNIDVSGAKVTGNIKEDGQICLVIDNTFNSLESLCEELNEYEELECELVKGCLTLTVLSPEHDLSLEIDHPYLLIPTNHYPEECCKDEKCGHNILEVGNCPPICPPTAEYVQDDGLECENIDLLENRAFQFMVQYVYCNDGKSPYGPISQLAVQTSTTCGECEYNCVEVDFTDDLLKDPCSEICSVNIAVREGNDGAWYKIGNYKRCELGVEKQTICFQNDQEYVPLSAKDIQKTTDAVPKVASSQNYINNRIIYGGSKEGENNIEDVDFKVEQECVPIENCEGGENKWTIKGRIRIWNALQFNDSNIIFKNQPIHKNNDTMEYPAFGGVGGFDNIGTVEEFVSELYQQTLPEGGWPVYLAGTQFFGISEQNEESAYNSTTLDDVNELFLTIQENDIYSEFEIKDVCPGTFVLRVGSHWCSFGDKLEKGDFYDLNNGTAWQRTSSYVKQIGGEDRTEVLITLPEGGGTFDLTTEPGYGEIVIMDLTAIETSPENDKSSSHHGYLFDSSGSSNQEDIQSSPRMELQRYTFITPGFEDNLRYPTDTTILTDHNGFYFATIKLPPPEEGVLPVLNFRFDSANALLAKNFSQDFYTESGLKELYEGDLGPLGATSVASTGILHETISFNYNEDITAINRTQVRGRIVEDNESCGLSSAIVAIEGTTRAEPTDSFGNYSILVYANANTNDRIANVAISSCGICCTNVIDPILVTIPEFVEDSFYSNEVFYELDDVIVNSTSIDRSRHLKNGGLYKIAIRYRSKCGFELVAPCAVTVCVECDKLNEAKLTYQIHHKAPPWACSYEIVRTEILNISDFLTWAVGEVKYVRKYGEIDVDGVTEVDLDETTYQNADAREIYISLQNLIDYNNENTSSVLGFEDGQFVGIDVEAGDYVKFLCDEEGNPLDLPEYAESVRVKGVRGEYIVIENIETLPEILPGFIFEIVKTKRTVNENVYWGTGNCAKVVDGLHMAGVDGQDQTEDQPATGCITGGDTYWVVRDVPIGEAGRRKYTAESFLESDFYASRWQDIGKASLFSEDNRELDRGNIIRISDIYQEGTELNGLESFDALDSILVDSRIGFIRKLEYVGNVLVVVGENGMQPLYIHGQEVVDADGNLSVVRDNNNLFNIGNTYRQPWGTQHPQSVVVEEGQMYGYDLRMGVAWRYSANGLYAISDVRMNTYFDKKHKEYYENEKDPDIVGSYDREYDEYLLTFGPILNVTEGETIAFNPGEQGKQRWTTFYSFVPEMYGRLGRGIFTMFKDGELWVAHTNELHNNFFGVQYPSQIQLVSNLEPTVVKMYFSTRVQSNDTWSYPEIVIPANESYPNGMSSRLTKNRFKLKEGDYWADFLRDLNDPKFNEELNALFKGRELRGKIIDILLENNSTERVVILGVDVTSYRSHLSYN